MTRPTDWWVLDLDGDPTPGSPSAVRTMARRWHEVAEDAAWAQRRVTSLMGDSVLGGWIGEAGSAFRARSSELPGQLGKCADSYGQAASALSWWADRLEDHQHSADAALARGRVARDDLVRAEAAARSAAEHTLSLAVPAFAGVAVPDVRDAQARLAAARSAQAHADALVADASSRLDLARRLGAEALALRESDGRAAAARIHEAADAGIPERSRWDKLKDWAGEAWDLVVKVARVVVAVLGVVALLLGGPLAWVVFAAALLLLADAITRYLQGKASLWEVAFSALGCIPGTKGLTSARAFLALSIKSIRVMARTGKAVLESFGRTPALTVAARCDRVFILDGRLARPVSTGERYRHLRHLELMRDYGRGGVRELADGRVRYYDLLKPAKIEGTMQGARVVRELNPTTLRERTWIETLDHSGRIRQMRPQQGAQKRHYMFDESGRHLKQW